MKKARTVLVAASVLGLLGDYLFHDSVFKLVPWGLNLFVWLLTVTVASLILTCRTKPTSQWKSAWFLVPPLFLAAGCVWRESVVLRCLDVVGVIFFLSAASLSMMGTRMVTAGISQYLLTVCNVFDSLVTSPILLLLKEVGWSTMIDDRVRSQANAVFRGLAIATPIVAVFGVLLITADAAFAGVVKNTLNFDVVQSFQHLLLGFGAFWWAGGYLFDMINGPLNMPTDTAPLEDMKPKLGIVEVGVVLGLIDLLFLSFVVVQAKYFFGGANLVELTSGMTYAEYARRGFFELVTVASLVLPILLTLDWLVEKTSAVGTLLIRSLTGIQISLLSVIMISAVQRMRLYQSEYGLTELRLYTTAFMAWLAIVCVVFMVTVLRGKRKTFAFASVMSGLAVVAGLHVINPDALIVTTNIAHAKEGTAFDVPYALKLSSDAVPPLMANLDRLNSVQRMEVIEGMRASKRSAWKADWRSWSLSGDLAYRSVSSYFDKHKIVTTDGALPVGFKIIE
jgi:hypothetical protein